MEEIIKDPYFIFNIIAFILNIVIWVVIFKTKRRQDIYYAREIKRIEEAEILAELFTKALTMELENKAHGKFKPKI